MIKQLGFIILLTLITGVGGLALGGGLAALIKRESPKMTSLLLSFTAGLMLCVVAFDMVPESISATGNYYLTPIFLIVGFLITFLLNCWIDKSIHHEDEEHEHHCACGHHDLHTAGIVLAAAVALHNLPIGLVIGTSVAAEGISHASILAAITIGLHNVPEGMSIAIPLLHDGSKARSAIAVSALSGIPTVIGAIIGFFVGSHTPLALAVAMSFAGGAMLYVIFFELLPEAYRAWRSKWSILATVIGFALGMVLLFSSGHMHIH